MVFKNSIQKVHKKGCKWFYEQKANIFVDLNVNGEHNRAENKNKHPKWSKKF